MVEEVPISRQVGIREAGYDEHWLQERIVAEPGCLSLGDLEVVQRERIQSSGGRLDLLLKNPDDDTMYEVELMLGETDESHIIRTIEYWDNERRKWPRRQHIAVIVAEGITARFYNVIHLLSHGLPLVAIQAALLQTESGLHLNFTKILDTYEEPEDDLEPREAKNEAYWQERASWTLDAAKMLADELRPVFPTLEVKFNQGIHRHYRGRHRVHLAFQTGYAEIMD